jgi:hypothetical protein
VHRTCAAACAIRSSSMSCTRACGPTPPPDLRGGSRGGEDLMCAVTKEVEGRACALPCCRCRGGRCCSRDGDCGPAVATDVACCCSNLTRGREERKDKYIPKREREETRTREREREGKVKRYEPFHLYVGNRRQPCHNDVGGCGRRKHMIHM